MAVYFQPQYKPWWADLANTALKEGLSGLMKGMFERDAYARTKNRSNNEWKQVFGDQTQTAQGQPSEMTIQAAPEVAKLGDIYPASASSSAPIGVSGTAQTPFGGDALGITPQTQAPRVTVPKEYLPADGDGLVATAGKARLGNMYAQSQIPTREDLMRRVLTTMSPQNHEAAVKYIDYMYGPQWKVGDQIYRGRQLENVLGAAPEINDKEANRQYINRQYLYGMDNAAQGGIQFLNPEYQRQYGAAEAEKQRAFQAQEAAKSRAFTASQNAISRAHQMNLARQRAADMLNRAMYGKRQNDADSGKLAAPFVKTLTKTSGELTDSDMNELAKNVRFAYRNDPATAEAILQYMSAMPNLLAVGEGEDMTSTTPTKANPYYGKYSEPFTVPEFRPQGYRLEYGGGMNGQEVTDAPGSPATLPRQAVEAFMAKTGLSYQEAEAALLRNGAH